MNLEITAKRLAELGHETRLAIYRELIKGGNSGVTVGDIQAAIGIPNSTLSHHISRLVHVGLVRQEREGTSLHCIAECDALNDVLNFLTEECCINDASCTPQQCG